MSGFQFQVGQNVRIDCMGLGGSRLRVVAYFMHPEGKPHYRLAFAHNGNIVPGLYDQRLITQ